MKKSIKNILQLNNIVFQNAKTSYILLLLQKLLDGFLPSLQVLIIAEFVDCAIDISYGKRVLSSIYSVGIVLIIILGIQYFMPRIVSFMETKCY